MVAGQQEDRVLPVRREAGARLLSCNWIRPQVQSKLDVEPYPKAGAPNPVVDLFVYDVAAKKTTRLDVRDGKPFDNDVVGHYVYSVSWSPGRQGTALQPHEPPAEHHGVRRGRPGDRRVPRDRPRGVAGRLGREHARAMRFLKDNNRFIWTSERTGWANFYLYDLSRQADRAADEPHAFEVASIVRVDEDAGLLYYMARSGDNHMKMQLHRVGLDGKGDVRLTDPAFNHTIDAAPAGSRSAVADEAGGRRLVRHLADNRYFVDVIRPTTRRRRRRSVDATARWSRSWPRATCRGSSSSG